MHRCRQTILYLSFAVALLIHCSAFTRSLECYTIDNWPPFMYTVNNNPKGIATDIVKAIMKEADLNYSIEVAPWIRAFTTVKNRKNTLIYMIYRTRERESQFKWVGPIIPAYPMYFYRRANRVDINITSLEQAKNYTVGVVRGVANHTYLLRQGFIEGVNLEAVASSAQNIQKLMAGRIDLIINSEYTLPTQLSTLAINRHKLQQIFSVVESQPAYIGFNIHTDDKIISKIEKAFKRLYDNGLYERVTTKHLAHQRVNDVKNK